MTALLFLDSFSFVLHALLSLFSNWMSLSVGI